MKLKFQLVKKYQKFSSGSAHLDDNIIVNIGDKDEICILFLVINGDKGYVNDC